MKNPLIFLILIGCASGPETIETQLLLPNVGFLPMERPDADVLPPDSHVELHKRPLSLMALEGNPKTVSIRAHPTATWNLLTDFFLARQQYALFLEVSARYIDPASNSMSGTTAGVIRLLLPEVAQGDEKATLSIKLTESALSLVVRESDQGTVLRKSELPFDPKRLLAEQSSVLPFLDFIRATLNQHDSLSVHLDNSCTFDIVASLLAEDLKLSIGRTKSRILRFSIHD